MVSPDSDDAEVLQNVQYIWKLSFDLSIRFGCHAVLELGCSIILEH